jgi:hypothetical protein
MSKKWLDLTKQQAGIGALVGVVLLAIGVAQLDSTSDHSVVGLICGLIGLGLLSLIFLSVFK